MWSNFEEHFFVKFYYDVSDDNLMHITIVAFLRWNHKKI